MSLDNVFSGVQSLSNTISGGVNTINRLSADLGGGLNAKAAYWIDRLRPASFRGISFGVLEGQLKFGRKAVVHDYPFRDSVWVEDLGRAARRISFSAFLVGDDCIAKRDLLMKACEDVGAVKGAELVHPTLGRMTVSLLEPVGCVERWDRGRVFEISFSFIEQGQRIFPNSSISTGDMVAAAVATAQQATAVDFLATVGGALKSGLAVVSQAVNTTQAWTRGAQRLVNDATNLYHFVQTLPGQFGRLFGGNAVRSASGKTSVQTLIAAGAVKRINVATTSTALLTTASGLTAASGTGSSAAAGAIAVHAYTTSVHSLASAVAAATPSPRDSLRALSGLIDASPALPATLTAPVYPVSATFPPASLQAVALMAGASSDMFRRAGVIALAQAAAAYQPTSYDDAATVRAMVSDRLDAEISIAGNQGQDATYNALRSLRVAIVQDLTQRGTSLAALMQVTTPQSLPALVLAQKLYRDSGRSDQLVAEANPIHPAFMPNSFKALTK
jgi:prophage DNA circulation protein